MLLAEYLSNTAVPFQIGKQIQSLMCSLACHFWCLGLNIEAISVRQGAGETQAIIDIIRILAQQGLAAAYGLLDLSNRCPVASEFT